MENHSGKKQIAFSLIGGMHHYLHIVPVVAALSKFDDIDVILFAPDGQDANALEALLDTLKAAPVTIIKSKSLSSTWLPKGLKRKWAPMKLPKLIFWANAIRAADVIVAAERTSTILKKLPGKCPPLIHIPHGVGDRKKGFEQRIRRFDHILVGGEKDRQRMIDEGVANTSNCHAIGGIKLSALNRFPHDKRAKFFHNDRRTILYNAHFEDSLASWQNAAQKIITDVAKSSDFNLIVAPHIRRFSGAAAREKAFWENQAIADKIIIDLDSRRLSDMSYVMAADIYLGDVSSQVYEFISRPRPCVFINSHQISWQNNEDYRMWQLGRVVNNIKEIPNALRHAAQDHERYVDKQKEFGKAAFGDVGEDAADKAARLIIRLVEQTKTNLITNFA